MFKKKYAQEIGKKSDLVQRLRKESEREAVTLLYSAKDIEHNNAVALKEIIEHYN